MVANNEETVGIFSARGGSECNVNRVEILLYVAKDLPFCGPGQADTRMSGRPQPRTLIKDNKNICGSGSLLRGKLSSTLTDELEFNSFFPHNAYALSLRCPDKS